MIGEPLNDCNDCENLSENEKWLQVAIDREYINYQELSNYVYTWYCVRHQYRENECENGDYVKIDLRGGV